MKLTRRTLLAGVAAIPAVAGLERLSAATHTAGEIFLFDSSLPGARERAIAATGWGQEPIEITGDRIRFARDILSAQPATVRGISRQADALLIEEVALEMGYRRHAMDVSGPTISWQLVRRR